MNALPNNKLVLIFALAGVVIGGAAGYAFGLYVFPQLGSQPLADQNGSSWMFCWIFAILGGIGGWQAGSQVVRRKRKLAQKQARLEKYADHLERFKQEKEVADARDAERKRQREALRGGDGSSRSHR